MKKNFLILGILLIAATSYAQEPRSLNFNIYGGYTFPDKVNFDLAYSKIKEGFQYGGGLEYFVQRNNSIELKYLRLDTDFPLYLQNGTLVNKGYEKGSLNYILIGGNNYFANSKDQKAIPFFGGDIGVGIVDGKGRSVTKFAWDLKLGVKVKTAAAISFKLEAYLQSIVSTFGSDYWVNSGGYIYSVPDYVTIFQFGLGGALCFNFHHKN